jgi:hypothetical protein
VITFEMTKLFEYAVGHERLGVLHALHDVVPFGFG